MSHFPYGATFATNPMTLAAGAPYAVDMTEKIHRVGEDALNSNANRDVANVLQVSLERHRFRLLGATTPQGLQTLEMYTLGRCSQLAVLEVTALRRDELSPWLQRFENHLARRLFFPSAPYPGKALNLIREILPLTAAARQARSGRVIEGEAGPVALEPGDVHEHVSGISGLAAEMVARAPVPRAWIDHGLPLLFGERIIGQPIAVLWVAGPTGVGKTEFAKVVAEFFFGSQERLLRYDMSEFKTRECLVRLVGGPGKGAVPGEPSLVQKIRAQPFAVLLFDPAPGLGFTGGAAEAPGADEIREVLMESYRPEFINRIEVIVPFGRLSRDDVAGILKVQVAELGQLPGLVGIRRIHPSEAVHDAILREGYQPRFGARPLRRAIDDRVLPCSKLICGRNLRMTPRSIRKENSRRISTRKQRNMCGADPFLRYCLKIELDALVFHA